MEKEKLSVGDISVTVALMLTALLLSVLLAFTQLLLERRNDRDIIPSESVLSFLTEYIPLRTVSRQEEVIEQYFSCVDYASIQETGASQDLLNINAVLRTDNPSASGFRICSVEENYLEFMLLDKAGDDLPCRIGFFYLLNNEGKISSYSILRLLPVSRLDSEWNVRWL